MKDDYKFLGLDENATDKEVDERYLQLREKYSKDRFLEGEEGNLAAKNLTKLESVYASIISERETKTSSNQKEYTAESGFGPYSDISDMIKQGKLDDAQAKLDDITDRSAEWHYLQSVLFYKKNWINESKKQLEIAISQDPKNTKYKDAYAKLNQKMSYESNQFHSGNANYGAQGQGDPNNRQMGGNECASFSECCATWCCLNLLCNGCCR